ncbi:hypothetical protein GJ496_010879 [Pomphorhynchus laevis]|nr:hypothetical protein GJ496_010879 [Pomphorhynchus laevis]
MRTPTEIRKRKSSTRKPKHSVTANDPSSDRRKSTKRRSALGGKNQSAKRKRLTPKNVDDSTNDENQEQIDAIGVEDENDRKDVHQHEPDEQDSALMSSQEADAAIVVNTYDSGRVDKTKEDVNEELAEFNSECFEKTEIHSSLQDEEAHESSVSMIVNVPSVIESSLMDDSECDIRASIASILDHTASYAVER